MNDFADTTLLTETNDLFLREDPGDFNIVHVASTAQAQNSGQDNKIVLNAIWISEMKLIWSENLPNLISETISVERKATIRLDDVSLEILNVAWPFNQNSIINQ